MNDNFNLKEIWLKQKIGEPNLAELLEKLNKYKYSNLRKLMLSNLLLVLTSAFIIYIWIQYQPQFLSTKLGIILVILAMVMFLFSNNKNMIGFTKIDNALTSNDCLKSLIDFNNKQKYIQKTVLSLYFIMLSIGLLFYFYEYTSRMSLLGSFSAYSITAIWIGFNWFYIRPKSIKKQQMKLDELIEKFEDLNNQLSND